MCIFTVAADGGNLRSEHVVGFTTAPFARLAMAFDELHAQGDESGAAVAVRHRGYEVLSLRSREIGPKDVQNVRSVSKAVVAILVHHLHETDVLDIDEPIARIWPEFCAQGKANLPLRSVLCHQSGLIGVDRALSVDDLLSWNPAVDAVAAQAPYWPPGTDHGYHDITFGLILGEVLRRTTGLSVGRLVSNILAKPLGLDLWIGTPAEVIPRVRPFRYCGDSVIGPGTLTDAASDPESLLYRSQMNPDISRIEHTARYLKAEVPGCNAVSNASSLGKLFASIIGEVDGLRLWSSSTLARATSEQRRGPDRVFGYDRAYSLGFMLPVLDKPLGGENTKSFGHYGQDCSLVFALPESDLVFSYTTTHLNSRLDQYARLETRASTLARMAVAAT